MKQYNLTFQGYTWDEYFYMISERRGILITYCGSLNNDGALRMDEILRIEGAMRLRDIYEDNHMKEIREEVGKKGGKLFFSYAEFDEDYAQIVASLSEILKPRYNNEGMTDKVSILCKGACALFPDKIISKQCIH